jgi:hypothetical protein
MVCNCKGDLALLHRACFQKWFLAVPSRRRTTCDVCDAPLSFDKPPPLQHPSWDMLSPVGQLARISFIISLYYFIALSGFALKWCFTILSTNDDVRGDMGEDLRLTAVFVCVIVVGAFSMLLRCSRRIFAYESRAATTGPPDTDGVLLPVSIESEGIKCAQ